MQFNINGKHVVLKGVPMHKLKVIEGVPSVKMLRHAAHLCFLQLKEVSKVKDTEQKACEADDELKLPPQKLHDLKERYKIIFEEPRELPPHRRVFDHTIPLELGALPVNIRPYYYPMKQRDVIERLIQEMLERGII